MIIMYHNIMAQRKRTQIGGCITIRAPSSTHCNGFRRRGTGGLLEASWNVLHVTMCRAGMAGLHCNKCTRTIDFFLSNNTVQHFSTREEGEDEQTRK